MQESDLLDGRFRYSLKNRTGPGMGDAIFVRMGFSEASGPKMGYQETQGNPGSASS